MVEHFFGKEEVKGPIPFVGCFLSLFLSAFPFLPSCLLCRILDQKQIMSPISNSAALTPPPERRLKDLVSASASWDADRLRQTLLETGLGALTAPDPARLILPPTAAPRRAENDKNLTRNRYLEVGIVTQGPLSLWYEGMLSLCPTGSVFLIPPGTNYLSHADPPDEIPHPQSVVWLALHRGCAVVHRCRVQSRNHFLSE